MKQWIFIGMLFFFLGVKAQEYKINWMTLPEAIEAQKTNPKKIMMDVYTTWCGPCKQLSPILKAWVKAQNGKVELIEIDVDENQELAKSKKIEAIPYLEMYKNGVKTWSSVGLIGKEELDKSLRD